jgi:hypothetical protein
MIKEITVKLVDGPLEGKTVIISRSFPIAIPIKGYWYEINYSLQKGYYANTNLSEQWETGI